MNCPILANSLKWKQKNRCVDKKFFVCKSLVNRNDDLDIEAINKRIDIFKTNISGIMSFYEKKSLIFFIDGLKDVNAINCEIIKALNSN